MRHPVCRADGRHEWRTFHGAEFRQRFECLGKREQARIAMRIIQLVIARIERLQRVYTSIQDRYPFETIAICVLPDHLHAVWSLPQGDANFPLRWNLIKSGFSRGIAADPHRSSSKIARREKGIWQRRYWEHAIRNEADLARHIDYVSFRRYVARGLLPLDWGGDVANMRGAFGE